MHLSSFIGFLKFVKMLMRPKQSETVSETNPVLRDRDQRSKTNDIET